MYNFWQNNPGKKTFIKLFTLSIYKPGPTWLRSPLTHLDPSLSLLSQTPEISMSGQL